MDRFARYILNIFDEADADDDQESNEDDDRIEMVVDEFEKAFVQRLKLYLSLVAFVLLFVLLLDAFLCGKVPDQTYGLSLDLLGAFILGRGLLNSPQEILEKAKSKYNIHPERLESLSKDLVDGIWGICLLVVGVLCQFIALIGIIPSPIKSCLL